MASVAAPAPITGPRLVVIAMALALGTFMQVLDTTIANVSLPTIAGTLGVSSDNSTWVITAFAVANGVTVPLTGWLMGRFGVVRTFCASVLLFTAASFLCGVAWSLGSLIFFRILQGAVSGPMIPGSQALLISIFPPNKRSTALGIWSMTTLVAPIAGPILGGFISDNYHWSWIFLINVPIGLLCGLVCWTGLSSRETPVRRLPIDRVGVALLVLWVGSLQIMLDLGKNDDWFHASRIVILAVLAAVGCAAWLIWELTDEHPVVNLSVFQDRNFAFGTISFCLAYAVFFANTLLLPLWLQTQLGYTATWAGLVAAPSGLIAVLLTPFASRLSNYIDARWLATIAMLSYAVSYYLRSQFTTQVTLVGLMIPMMIQGISMATLFLAMLTISLDRMPPALIPAASGMSNFCRITAGGFSASIITTAWDRREALHQGRLAEAVGTGAPFQAARSALAQMGFTDVQAAAAMSRQLVGQAYLLALTDIFRVSAWLCVLLGFTVWLTRRPRPPSGPVAAD